MNGLRGSRRELTRLAQSRARSGRSSCDILICPPATLIGEFAALAKGSAISIGAQDCHAAAGGAHTGDISAQMLKNSGAKYVIVGHSERRADHGESDPLVRAKAEAAHRAGLTAIVCVGETLAERKGGKALGVVGRQLKGSLPADAGAGNLVVAYEPVWAIGSGLVPSLEDIAKVHGFIRRKLTDRYGAAGQSMRILYGGSVNPGNAGDVLSVENVNGALVGGASLKAKDLLGIIQELNRI